MVRVLELLIVCVSALMSRDVLGEVQSENTLLQIVPDHEHYNNTDIEPLAKCNSCYGKKHRSKCGKRGLNGKSVCLTHYTGQFVCIQNGYCSDYKVYCTTDSDCALGQACAYAACSTLTKCYDLCEKDLYPPTPPPTLRPTAIPTTAFPTKLPSPSPTVSPTIPACSICSASEMYTHCGSRGLHDYSFCTVDEVEEPVCIQNMYCNDVTRACNSTEQCNLGDVCAISGCTSNEYYCHRRCVIRL